MNESIYGDPYETALLTASDEGAARAAALRARSTRSQQPLAMPSSGVETPPPQPGADPRAAPQIDYRGEALKSLQQAGNTEPSAAEKDESNRRLMLALTLSATGGESLAPVGAQMLKQALADPEIASQRRQQRLESQAKIYESMAVSSESLEQRREAARQADAMRREIAAGQNETRRLVGEAATGRSRERADETRAARSFTQENTLRDDFEKQVKDQRISIATYPQIEAALTQPVPSAAADMRAIFRYMKMLDPTSVVREGEFATAKNAAGIPERILNTYNRALSGTMLSPQQRADFLGQAKSERDTAMKFFNERAGEFGSRARGYNLNPRNVVLGYEGMGGGGDAGATGGGGWGIVR